MSEKIIEKIQAAEFSRKELENLYTNAKRLGREEILTAAKKALKEMDAKFYSKRFIKPIRDKVQQITQHIADTNNWANWENNKVDNGVKAGGAMLNGEELAEFYFSYRHPAWKSASCLAVFQHDEESYLMYKVKPHDGEQVIVETNEEAMALFSHAIETT
jgi:hypothetical protein